MEPIQLNEIWVLLLMHGVIGGGLIGLGFWLLSRRLSLVLGGLIGLAWVWSAASLLVFWSEYRGFWSWLLNPSAERNLTAIVTSTLLLLIGLTALVNLLRKDQAIWQRAYWLLLTAMFLFLALDEYASLHETITFWRQGYFGLGAAIVFLSVIMLVRDKQLRPAIVLFVMGFGAMGFAGVYLDAFSNEHILDIGPIMLGTCEDRILGIQCRDYSVMEEMMEVMGASTMFISLLATALQAGTVRRMRLVGVMAGVWAFILVGWLWIFPTFENILATPLQMQYADVEIIGYSLAQDRIQAGDEVAITVYARTRHAVDKNYALSLHLYTQAVNSVAHDDMKLGEFSYPTTAWITGVPIRNRFMVTIPDDLPTSASYYLVAIVWTEDPYTSLAVQTTDRFTLIDGQAVVLQSLVAPPIETPPVANTAQYQFAEGIRLAGYDLPASINGQDTARFWWETGENVSSDLNQFLHWFNLETDEFFTFDRQPFGGNFPTRDWLRDLQLYDEWVLTIPDEMPAGRYRVQTGLYDIYTYTRLAATDANGQAIPDNSIVLGEVEIIK